MAGISDIRHELCLGLALWNGKDPILKERMFGLTGPEGNHGEDAKEYWWYLEGLPSHALLHWRYHYPQGEFPYERLVDHGRGLHDPELELLDTGAFDDDRYWSVEVTYAKATPTEVLMRDRRREPRARRGHPRRAAHAVVPQHLVVGRRARPGRASSATARRCGVERPRAGRLPAGCRARPRRRWPRGAVLRERDQPAAGLRRAAEHALPEGRHQRPRRLRRRDGQPGRLGTKAALRYRVTVPAGRHGRAAAAAAPPGRATRPRGPDWAATAFDDGGRPRARPTPTSSTRPGPGGHDDRGAAGAAPGQSPGWCGASRSTPTTSRRWLDGDPGSRRPPAPGAASATRAGGTSTPSTCWPCPTRGSTRGSPPGTSRSTPSPGRTSTRPSRSTRCWCCCASGSSTPTGPCPPTSGTSTTSTRRCTCWRRCGCSGSTARATGSSSSGSSRSCSSTSPGGSTGEDEDGNNVFGGGFLGLDNISPIDRSQPPRRRPPRAGRRHGVDGVLRDVDARHRGRARARRTPSTTTWSSSSSSSSSRSGGALEDQGLYDAEDAFFYDRLVAPSGESTPVQVRTIAGLVPLLPAVGAAPAPGRPGRPARQGVRADPRAAGPTTGGTPGGLVARARRAGRHPRLGARTRRAAAALREFLDEDAFLSPHGLRSSPSATRATRTPIPGDAGRDDRLRAGGVDDRHVRRQLELARPGVDAAELPAVRQFVVWQRFLGDDFTLEYPTGSGQQRTLRRDRAGPRRPPRVDLAAGRRRSPAGVRRRSQRLQEDPAWKDNLLFFEYFHGDDGAGLGAMHQTGWTALVVDLLLDPPGRPRTG